jgi:SAM-dependent methyltransferase
MKSEFDHYAPDYDALLQDPIRDRFAASSAFFHYRKWRLLEDFLRRQGMSAGQLAWLDVGCGKGELLRCGGGQFAAIAGCDPSEEMLRECRDLPIHHQAAPRTLPFGDASFDVVTAACVYHHLMPEERRGLTQDVRRVLRPGGLFAIFEHNPRNPVTRLIVSRTPVDANAVLLTSSESRRVLRVAGIEPLATIYYLFLPQALFDKFGRIERLLTSVPFGGQYAVIGRLIR